MSLFKAVPCCVALAVLSALATPAPAQYADPGADEYPGHAAAHRLLATRAELERQLEQLGGLALAGRRPRWLPAETSYLQERLVRGDFRTGDRILITVDDWRPLEAVPPVAGGAEKSPEQQLSDTFTVGSAQDLALPGLGPISLHGVLRAELAAFLTREVRRSVKDPVVRVWPLVNVGVTGEVTRPGFYAMTPDAVMPALLNAAGGPTKDAELSKAKIERDGKTVWKGNELRHAMELGETLDQLALQTGDVVEVPAKHSLDSVYHPLQFIALLGSIAVAAYAVASHIKF